MGNVLRTLRIGRSRRDLPDTPDADLDAEPEELICPITRTMFRDPVMVVESGHTYERSAILSHFRRNGAKDPLTGLALSSTKVMTIWAVRQIVQAWLDKHPSVTPDGWDSRELLEPSKGDGTRTFDDEGDVGVLRTWRAMCPELQRRWPEDEPAEQWRGVTMENGRVVQLDLQEFGLTGAVPAEIGQLTSLERLYLNNNRLTSVPAEIWQLTSLEKLWLSGNQLTSLAGGALAAYLADAVGPHGQPADERAGGDRAAHVAEDIVPRRQSADECAGGDRAAHVAAGVVPRRQSADEFAGGDWAAHVSSELGPRRQSADERAGGDRAAHVAEVCCTSPAIS